MYVFGLYICNQTHNYSKDEIPIFIILCTELYIYILYNLYILFRKVNGSYCGWAIIENQFIVARYYNQNYHSFSVLLF